MGFEMGGYLTDAAQAKFDYKALKEAANGTFNMGELLLGKGGKLVHINSRVKWWTSKNNIVSTAEQNRAVREAISTTLNSRFHKDTGEPMSYALENVLNYLNDEKNHDLPLSRDEIKKLIELCESGETDKDKIDNRMTMIGELAKLKREGVTDDKIAGFEQKLRDHQLADESIKNWITGLSVEKIDKKTGWRKAVMSQTASQRTFESDRMIDDCLADYQRKIGKCLSKANATTDEDCNSFVETLKGIVGYGDFEKRRKEVIALEKIKKGNSRTFTDEDAEFYEGSSLAIHGKNYIDRYSPGIKNGSLDRETLIDEINLRWATEELETPKYKPRFGHLAFMTRVFGERLLERNWSRLAKRSVSHPQGLIKDLMDTVLRLTKDAVKDAVRKEFESTGKAPAPKELKDYVRKKTIETFGFFLRELITDMDDPNIEDFDKHLREAEFRP